MEFKVFRTTGGASQKPCEGAFKRTTCIKETNFKHVEWFVNISTFEEMLAFADEYGPIILGQKENTIEIYDAWEGIV